MEILFVNSDHSTHAYHSKNKHIVATLVTDKLERHAVMMYTYKHHYDMLCEKVSS